VIHNSPPIASITPLQSNLITLIAPSDSKSKKKTNHICFKSRNKGIKTVADVLERQIARTDKLNENNRLVSFLTGKSGNCAHRQSRYEDDVLQPAFARHMDKLQAKNGNFVWFHVPNGGKRSIGVGKKLKAQGVKRGVPDNHVLLDNGKTLYIELKTTDGSLSKEQKALRTRAIDLGHKIYVIKCAHPVDVEQKTSAIMRENGVLP